MTEQQPHEVVRAEDGWELRRYPQHVVAETTVGNASFEDAGNRAFRSLVGYINGENTRRQSIAMTAPVVQTGGTDGYVVAFVLPAAMTEADAPVPARPEVRLRTVPERLVAAARFSGRWTHESWERHRDELLARLAAAGITVVGEPRFARFDPPFTPWFLRRNEVLVDVEE